MTYFIPAINLTQMFGQGWPGLQGGSGGVWGEVKTFTSLQYSTKHLHTCTCIQIHAYQFGHTNAQNIQAWAYESHESWHANTKETPHLPWNLMTCRGVYSNALILYVLPAWCAHNWSSFVWLFFSFLWASECSTEVNSASTWFFFMMKHCWEQDSRMPLSWFRMQTKHSQEWLAVCDLIITTVHHTSHATQWQLHCYI